MKTFFAAAHHYRLHSISSAGAAAIIVIYLSLLFSRGTIFCSAQRQQQETVCFETNNELKGAAGRYSLDPSNESTEDAVRYGYPIGDWCVDNIEDFSDVFFNQRNFNEPLTNWSTSRATSMSGMFLGAESFNEPVQDYFDTSNVTSMKAMFYGATSFNQPLSKFDTSSVTDMSFMFFNAGSFNNQNLTSFNLSSVITMKSMFLKATSFNQNLCSWGEMLQQHNNLDVDVTNMFNETSCPIKNDPDLSVIPPGPFCHVCDPNRTVNDTEAAPEEGPSSAGPAPPAVPAKNGLRGWNLLLLILVLAISSF